MNDFLKDKKFILLNDQKQPLHSLDKFYPYDSEEVSVSENIGVLVEDNFVVIDVDNKKQADKMYEYIKFKKYKANIMQTTRGKHFWFKNDKPLNNSVKIQNALSVECDVRSFGKKSFVVVKSKGSFRFWLETNENISFMPKELTPINDKLLNSRPVCIGMKEGEGRRDALFLRIIPLIHNGYNKEELHQLFLEINNFIFDTPLSKKEIDNMFTDDQVFYQIRASQFFDQQTKKFLHYKFAEWIHKELNGLFKNGSYYYFKDGSYVNDKHSLMMFMTSIIKTLKREQRNETYSYLETLTSNENLIEDPYVVSLKNGLFDLKNNVFLGLNSKYFDTNQLNVEYNKDANEKIVTTFINDVCDNNKDLVLLLEEIIGCCLIKNTNFQKAFLLLGGGANGKTTFIEAIQKMFGAQNCSSLSLNELSSKNTFALSTLVGKMVNISSETPRKIIEESNVFKSLVTGDTLTLQFKYQDPFNYNNYAKFIFAANEMPKVDERSFGFFRRFIVFPFNNIFTEEKRDEQMLEKLTTKEALSTWLNIAIKGAQRLIKNKKFSETNETHRLNEMFKADSNSIQLFLETYTDQLVDYDVMEFYNDFKKFTMNVGLKTVDINTFITEVLKRYNHLKIEIIKTEKMFLRVFKNK